MSCGGQGQDKLARSYSRLPDDIKKNCKVILLCHYARFKPTVEEMRILDRIGLICDMSNIDLIFSTYRKDFTPPYSSLPKKAPCGTIEIHFNASPDVVRSIYLTSNIYVNVVDDCSYGVSVGNAMAAGLEIITIDTGNPTCCLLKPLDYWIPGAYSSAVVNIENIRKSFAKSSDDESRCCYLFSSNVLDSKDVISLDMAMRQCLENSEMERRLIRCNVVFAAMSRLSNKNKFKRNFIYALTHQYGDRLPIME
eukprot:GHVH01004436.1.p1 GENE.GHVH01004436.1~~GHVH01004436.1.p1  ORF type:complete len:252 (-),score=26.87 GHVH01004436.1:40-795(-)